MEIDDDHLFSPISFRYFSFRLFPYFPYFQFHLCRFRNIHALEMSVAFRSKLVSFERQNICLTLTPG